MKLKIFIFIVMFLMSKILWAGNFEDAVAAYNKKNYYLALPLFKSEVVQGNPNAQVYLGIMYVNGFGVVQDKVEAVKLFRLAANQGDQFGQLNLAYAFSRGDGVSVDLSEAFRFFKLSAEQGNASAQVQLALAYMRGSGVNQNKSEAIRLYKLAANNGNAQAQVNLGYLYERGDGVTKDLTEAIRFYKLSADQGNLIANINLGLIYRDGIGVSKDLTSAFRFFKFASDKGNAHAQVNLGYLYERGDGVTKDLTEALRLYLLSADQKNSIGQYRLGALYRDGGVGVVQDLSASAKFFKLSADQGNAQAQVALGFFYEKGLGLTADLNEALRLYRLASAQGNSLAQRNLGVFYENGFVVSKDAKVAYMWYSIAAENSYPKIQTDLNRIKNSLSNSQIDYVVGLVDECKKNNLINCAGDSDLLLTSLNSNSQNTNQISKPKLKIKFLYVGPIGDGGWTYAAEKARQTLQIVLGDKIETSFVENVPESSSADQILIDSINQGNKIIFGTTFGYMDSMIKVANDFKDVKFEHATGYKQMMNMNTYDSRTYEGSYLAGVIAGAMTRSNVLGFVGSVPIPEVIRNINSFTLGAQSVNPKIKTKVVWVNQWFNPPKETEAATFLINSGADILFQNTDSPAVLKTAEDKGKRAFGWDSDMTAYGPKAHLASAVVNWAPYYIKTTKDYLAGTWVGNQKSWWGVKEGAIDLVSIAFDVPAITKSKIEEIKKGLIDGNFAIWHGPIVDNKGKLMLNKDEVADDEFLAGMSFYVRGVEGIVPGYKNSDDNYEKIFKPVNPKIEKCKRLGLVPGSSDFKLCIT